MHCHSPLHHGAGSTDGPALGTHAPVDSQPGNSVSCFCNTAVACLLLTPSQRQRQLQSLFLACPSVSDLKNHSAGELPLPISQNPLRGASTQDPGLGMGQEHVGEYLPLSQKNTASAVCLPAWFLRNISLFFWACQTRF